MRMPGPTRRHATESGITLIELLIAVTLLSLLSVGMLFAMRIGLNSMGKTNKYIANTRRVLGADRIINQQLAGFIPVKAICAVQPGAPAPTVPFFQGELQTMRFVSSFSLQEAARGLPRILEFQVIPGENGQGVRLVVNEHIYTGPLSVGAFCAGLTPDPESGTARVIWRPVLVGPGSFVLADKLAYCRLTYKLETEPEKPADLWLPRWPHEYTPAAVSIDWAPLEPDPSRLQLPALIAPFRVNRSAYSEYID